MSNTAVVTGRNLNSGWPLEAQLAYVDATLTDQTPATPLNPWRLDETRVQVRAARVRVTEAGLSRAVAELAGGRLPRPRVYLKPGNRVGLTGTATWHGLPVPVAMDYQLARVDGHTVRLTPCGLTGGAARLAGVDFRKLLQDPRVDAQGVITLDLGAMELRELQTGQGTLDARVGDAEPPAGPAASWCEIRCQGDFDAGGGLLRDATAVCSAPTTMALNDWQRVGSARLVQGRAAIAPAQLKAQIEAAEPLFKVGRITLKGTTYQVQGTYNAGIKLPTRFDLTFTRTADGQLRLTPGDVRVVGLKAGKLDDLAQLAFLKPDGDGYRVDLKAAAGLDMPQIGPLESQNGCLMLTRP